MSRVSQVKVLIKKSLVAWMVAGFAIQSAAVLAGETQMPSATLQNTGSNVNAAVPASAAAPVAGNSMTAPAMESEAPAATVKKYKKKKKKNKKGKKAKKTAHKKKRSKRRSHTPAATPADDMGAAAVPAGQ
jgi:hypothetical protein